MSKSCTSTINGRLKQFSLSLAAFVLFLVGAIISAYCRCKDSPYKKLHSESRLEPRKWGLDKDSRQSSLKQIQIVHTARPFMYSYRDHGSSLKTVIVDKTDATAAK